MISFPLGLNVTSLAGVLQKQVSLAMHSPETQVSYFNEEKRIKLKCSPELEISVILKVCSRKREIALSLKI